MTDKTPLEAAAELRASVSSQGSQFEADQLAQNLQSQVADGDIPQVIKEAQGESQESGTD